MFGREIFRKSSLEKMTTPEELDELLQVNSVKTWLLFAAICAVLAGMLLWGFLGVITQETAGFGIIRIHELPREVISQSIGQVDSVFFKTGDKVEVGQKLLTISRLEEKTHIAVSAPFNGEVTGFNVREGTFVTAGLPLLELVRNYDTIDVAPEVIFFVKEQEIPKLKTGMVANIRIVEAAVPPDFLTGKITFVAGHPASRSAILKYFPDNAQSLQLDKYEFHEVRASMLIDPGKMSPSDRSMIQSFNGLNCLVQVTVSRQSPIAFLLH
ncbi:MAG: biotin/lipoyl-containing protein [Bacteroidota bacterium]